MRTNWRRRKLIGVVLLAPLLDDDLFTRKIRVLERDVVYVKGIFEASEGLGAVFALPRSLHEHRDDGGVLTVAAPRSRAADLEELLRDLQVELDGTLSFVD